MTVNAETKDHNRDLFILISPSLFVLLWSTGFLGIKLGSPHADPMTFLSIRFALTTVLLTAFVLLVRAPWPVTAAAFGHTMVVGTLIHLTYISGVLFAVIEGVSTGVVALVMGIQPLITAALVGRVLGERVSAIQWAGLLLGFVGVGLVVFEKLSIGEATPLGFFFAALGLTGITGGTLYQKRFCDGADLRTGLVIQIGTAFVLSFAIAFLFEDMRVEWTGELVFAVVWLSLVVSIGAFTLLMLLLRRGAMARVTVLLYLTPPTTAVLGWFFFSEALGPLALIGMAVAVVGVALVNR